MREFMQGGRRVQSNSDLHEYLLWLGSVLDEVGEPLRAEELRLAARFASGSATEFLHEAQLALEGALRSDATLTVEQREELAQVISQIADAFRSVGGA